jgi:hypothetical protein
MGFAIAGGGPPMGFRITFYILQRGCPVRLRYRLAAPVVVAGKVFVSRAISRQVSNST